MNTQAIAKQVVETITNAMRFDAESPERRQAEFESTRLFNQIVRKESSAENPERGRRVAMSLIAG